MKKLPLLLTLLLALPAFATPEADLKAANVALEQATKAKNAAENRIKARDFREALLPPGSDVHTAEIEIRLTIHDYASPSACGSSVSSHLIRTSTGRCGINQEEPQWRVVKEAILKLTKELSN